ncbi:MAG: molybdate ABC transporter substrate-binding protein [Phreatobacter sp.]
MARRMAVWGLALMAAGWVAPAGAAELRVMATGASKAVVQTIASQFEVMSGHHIVLVSDTAGGVQRRVEAGEAADVIVATPAVINALAAKGLIRAGSRTDLARTGIGVAVREGAPIPDISSVEAIERLLKSAATIAYVDPASGGTSGIYFAGLIERLGLTEAMRPKLRLKAGGYVAELVANGEAEVVFHQISEILPVRGVTLVGPLPPEIQSITTYTVGLAAVPAEDEAARAFLIFLTSPASTPVLMEAGMEPARTP